MSATTLGTVVIARLHDGRTLLRSAMRLSRIDDLRPMLAGLAAAGALLLSLMVRRRFVSTLARRAAAAAPAPSAALTGILYRYKDEPGPLQAFESPVGHQHRKFYVYVGGLTDGLLACKYVELLAHELDRHGWALVQPVLSSSCTGYGCSSLARDAEELSELLSQLDRRGPVEAFAIVGHSTGCQDAVTLCAAAPSAVRAKLRAAVLQAPVSDRESDSQDAALLADAERRVATGQGAALLPDNLHNDVVPISAERYASLNGRLGPDDMFSSDLSDDELASILRHMGTAGQRAGVRRKGGEWLVEPLPEHPGLRTCFCHSGGDEYVPPHVNVERLSQRFVAAAGGAENGAEAVIIRDGNHNLETPPEAAVAFVEVVVRVLTQPTIGPR